MFLEVYRSGQLFLTIRRSNGRKRQYEDDSVQRSYRIIKLFKAWLDNSTGGYYERH